MKTLDSKQDLADLVDSFYAKIRKDEMLGPIFNKHIAEDEWPAHLSKLTDFWEMKLLGGTNFKGSPTRKHIEVDKASGHTIQQEHFAHWLRLWHETIDATFTGELAERAKTQSRKMATGQFIGVWQSKP